MFRRECESIRPLISAFFDGDLTPSESTILHSHLAACTECRAIVDEYQRIRSGLRDLPQASPPENLASTVWSETVERPRQTGIRRFFGATTAKVGLSTVAALAILAVISAFLVVRGYNQGLTPAIAGSEPTTSQNWPVYQPVKIAFNKPMNHQSVEENLQIWPPGERDRIPTSWQGNTLVLGSSSSQSTLFLPSTNYQVMVLGTAQDAYGHQIGRTWSISFTTSTVTNTAQNQTPTPAETATPKPTGQPTRDSAIAAVTATATTPSTGGVQSTATPGNTGSGQGSTGQPTPTAPPSTPSSNPGAVRLRLRQRRLTRRHRNGDKLRRHHSRHPLRPHRQRRRRSQARRPCLRRRLLPLRRPRRPRRRSPLPDHPLRKFCRSRAPSEASTGRIRMCRTNSARQPTSRRS